MSIDKPLGDADAFPDITVAAIQMEPEVGQKARNLQRSLQRIEQAAARGAQIIVLPELANTGYMFRSREDAAGWSHDHVLNISLFFDVVPRSPGEQERSQSAL